MGSSSRTRSVCLSIAALMMLSTVLPVVAGDGMPAYHIVDVTDPDHPDLFSTTFESRQLARVDLVNDTHERIRLFLSVYSLDPGTNLTIMVPLRTLPENVRGEAMKESEFRKEYMLDRVETEVVQQDPEEANAKLWEETSTGLQTLFGSMLLTYPGEYSRQNFRLVSDGKGREDSAGLGGGGEVILEPEPVQHYEFDGFSIDVFGVDAAGILDSYLADKGLVLPDSDDLDEYRDQYVAVVEAGSKPPIDADDYEMLRSYAPNSTDLLIEEVRSDPKRNEDQIWDLKRQIYRAIRNELPDNESYYDNLYQLENIEHDLVDAVFGATDFEGETLTIDLPLDGDNIFFPLGTSAGWPNQVGDIDILFRVPEGKDLAISKAQDAYFDGHHWYLFSMEQANPGFDLESPLLKGSEERRTEAGRAEWIYESSENLGLLIAAIILLVLWFGFSFFLRRTYEIEGRLVRDPLLWAMLGLSLLISLPGALLVYLLARPVEREELTKRLATVTPVAMYPAAAVMLVLAVVL
jgi:hypothetical protein